MIQVSRLAGFGGRHLLYIAIRKFELYHLERQRERERKRESSTACACLCLIFVFDTILELFVSPESSLPQHLLWTVRM